METFVTVLVLLTLAAVGACHLIYPSHTHRYRLTLEVEADSEVRTGSGVVEVTWQRQPQILPQVLPWTSSVRGQAVPVDLGRHGVLLAVLSGSGPRELWGVGASYLALRAFAGTVPGLSPLERARPYGGDDYPLEGATPAVVARLPAGTRVALALDNMPQLVWLPDPGNRSSARPVPPADLSGAVAPGVRLRGAWIEITRDRVTRRLGERLPWLAAFVAATRPHLRIFQPGVYQLTWDALSKGVDP